MYANRDFSIWNFESQMSSDYRAKEDGRLYANEWYTNEREVFIITERMDKRTQACMR